MKKILSVLLVFSFFIQSVNSQSNPIIDSLVKVIPTLNDSLKLKAFSELAMLAVQTRHEKAPEYISQYQEEAKRQNNNKSISSANGVEFNWAIYSNDTVKLIEAYKKASGFAREHKMFDHLSRYQSQLVNYYINQRQIEKAIAHAKEMQGEAVESNDPDYMASSAWSLAAIHLQSQNYEDAIRYYNESLNILRSKSKTVSPQKIADHFNRLAGIYANMNQYDKVLLYADSMKMYSQKNSLDINSNRIIFRAETFTAMALIGLGNLSQAWKHIIKAEEILDPSWKVAYDHERKQLDIIYLAYYKEKGDYNKALEYTEKALAYARKYKFELQISNFLVEKCILLTILKRNEEAAEALQEATNLSNEYLEKKFHREAADLRTQYEVDKLEMKAEQDRLKIQASRNYIIGLCIILVLFVVLVIIISRYNSQLKNKNRSLFHQIQDEDKLLEEIEKWKKLTAKLRLQILPQENEQDKEDIEVNDLYERFNDLIADPQVYTNPDINRKMIADMLNTNEKYLSETIKKYFDVGFSEYITSLRLHYSRKLLIENGGKLTIEAIAIESGFGSRNTFHRLFREHYGMTPDEFRKLAYYEHPNITNRK